MINQSRLMRVWCEGFNREAGRTIVHLPGVSRWVVVVIHLVQPLTVEY